MSLDSYVIIEYIKSSVDIILNLKFEEIEKRLLDKNISDSKRGSITSQAFKRGEAKQSQRSVTSEAGPGEEPPKVYEELIQSLEGEVRKHIRIEQQLKLHIESMENRIEELENQQEKKDGEKKT